MIHTDKLIPFWGVVEENDDPDKLGRVQVRCYGYHPRNKGRIPTDGLPWMMPTVCNSSGVSGIGQTPYYAKGSTVFGFFLDKSYQIGMILGAISTAPIDPVNPSKGFNDPDGMLPNYEPDEADMNRLARKPEDHWIQDEKEEISVDTNGAGTWNELPYNNNCLYPMNHVYETEAGHVVEYDETKDEERYHNWHPSGTYREVIADGTHTLKVKGKGYEIIMDDKNAYVKGNCNLTVDSDCNTLIKGDWNVKVSGDWNMDVGKNVNKKVGADETVSINGTNKKKAGGIIDYDASFIELN